MNLAYLFTLFVSFVAPLGLALFLLFTKSAYRKPFFLGVLTFTVFQLLTRIPILQVYLSQQSWFIVFSMKYPLGYIVFLSFTAALFEEGGRYLVYKKGLPSLSKQGILWFGLGHGGIEALALVGIPYLLNDVSNVPSFMLMMGGVERVSAILLHIALSFWVYQSIRTSSKGGLWVAMSLHTSFNVFALILLQFNTTIWLVELILFGCALLAFLHQWTLKENV